MLFTLLLQCFCVQTSINLYPKDYQTYKIKAFFFFNLQGPNFCSDKKRCTFAVSGVGGPGDPQCEVWDNTSLISPGKTMQDKMLHTSISYI